MEITFKIKYKIETTSNCKYKERVHELAIFQPRFTLQVRVQMKHRRIKVEENLGLSNEQKS